MQKSYDELRALIQEKETELSVENPDSIYHFADDAITFIYLPNDNSLYQEQGIVTHPTLVERIPELKRKLRVLNPDAGWNPRQPGIINGRLTTQPNYHLIKKGFMGVISFWKSTIRNKTEFQACLKKLLDEFLIEPYFLVVSGKYKPALVIDIMQNTQESTGYSSRVNELMGMFHLPGDLNKQKAFAELKQISKEYPEDQHLQALIKGLESRLPASAKKDSTLAPLYFGPGSGLEKHFGADKKDLERRISNLGMKRNPITGYLEQLNFKEWLNQIDEKGIDSVYDKAYLAVELVRMYDMILPPNKKLLNNISTIANLPSGAYGLYNSSENKNIIPSDVRLKFGPDAFKNKLENVPRFVLNKYLKGMGLPHAKVTPSDVIHVNIHRILSEYGDSLEAILEIASTIVHEATHELERETIGQTNETGPRMAEQQFILWFKNNKLNILKKIPQLNSINSGF